MSKKDFKSILVYGDSNTWGYVPQLSDDIPKQRYAFNERWCGILANNLGDDYRIIEQGLCGRNTCVDDFYISDDMDWNGMRPFVPILDSSLPIELLIIMLGTNDLRSRLDMTLEKTVTALEKYVDLTHQYAGTETKILIISPVPITLGKNDNVNARYGERAPDSFLLGPMLLQKFKDVANVSVFDAQRVVPVADGVDGLHLSKEAHKKLGAAITKVVRDLLTK